jgi:hypothetical protein
MYQFAERYRIYERVAGILVLVMIALYMLSCLALGEIASLGQFGDYVCGLVAYIFRVGGTSAAGR